jgi:hypothetical protein
MPTAKQIAASRANGQKSHGPVTPEGKSKCRFNALKHGIHPQTQVMFDENAEDLAELAAELHEQYTPVDPTERFLVDTLINNEWRLRRLRCVESDLWQTGVDTYLNKHAERERGSSGEAFSTIAPAFERLQRIVNCCERNYHRALKQILALQAARDYAQPAPQPEGSTTTSESSGSFRTNPQSTPEPPLITPETPTNSLAADRDPMLQEDAQAFTAPAPE